MVRSCTSPVPGSWDDVWGYGMRSGDLSQNTTDTLNFLSTRGFQPKLGSLRCSEWETDYGGTHAEVGSIHLLGL